MMCLFPLSIFHSVFNKQAIYRGAVFPSLSVDMHLVYHQISVLPSNFDPGIKLLSFVTFYALEEMTLSLHCIVAHYVVSDNDMWSKMHSIHY